MAQSGSKHRWAVLSAALLFVLSLSCRGEELLQLEIGSKQFYLEIADDQEERSRGLMFRDSLKEDHGMIFIFQRDRQLSFWMKDTKIPLSLAYIDREGRIVDILPLSPGDLQSVSSSRSVRYAIELNRGAFQRAGVEEGDRIDLTPLHERMDR